MTRHVGAVIFADSTKAYLIYDGAADSAMRPLFPTEKAAREWREAGMPEVNEPSDAVASDEPVTVVADVALEMNGGLGLAGSFASRASKKTMWLTGARSFFEMIYENGATACRVF